MSDNYCIVCKKAVSSKEVNGKVHNGGGVRCGGKIEYRTYELTITQKLIAIDNKPHSPYSS